MSGTIVNASIESVKALCPWCAMPMVRLQHMKMPRCTVYFGDCENDDCPRHKGLPGKQWTFGYAELYPDGSIAVMNYQGNQ